MLENMCYSKDWISKDSLKQQFSCMNETSILCIIPFFFFSLKLETVFENSLNTVEERKHKNSF